MRRRLRIAAYALAGLAALAAVLTVAGVIVLQTPWFREKVRQRIISEVERATGGRMELRAFRFHWKSMTAEVDGLVLHGREPAGEPPLFRAASVRLGLRIISVLKRSVDLQTLEIERPETHLIVFPDGSLNLPVPKVRHPGGKPVMEQIVNLAIDRIDLHRGTLQLDLEKHDLELHGREMRLQLFYDFANPSYRGNIGFGQLQFDRPGGPPLPLRFAADLLFLRNRLMIPSARAGLGESEAQLSGTVGDIEHPRVELDYTGRLRLLDAGTIFNTRLPARGTVGLHGHFSYVNSTDFLATGRLQAAGLTYQESGIRVSDIAVLSPLRVTPQGAQLPGLLLTALGGQARGQAELREFRDLRVETQMQGFQIERLSRVQGIPHAAWNGALSGPLLLTASLRQGGLRDLVVNSQLNVAPAPGANPIEGFLDLTYRHEGGTLEFRPSRLALPSSKVEFNGTLGQHLDVALDSGNLDDFEPAVPLLGGTPGPIPVRLNQGQATFRGSVDGPLKAPVISGQAGLRNFEFEKRSFDSLQAQVQVTGEGASASDLMLRKGAAEVTGTARVGMRDWKIGDASSLAAQVNVRSSNLRELVHEAGQDLPVEGGTTTAQVQLGGTLGAPAANIQAKVQKFSAFGQPVDVLETGMRYDPQAVRVDSVRVVSGGSQAIGSLIYRNDAGDWNRGRLRFQIAALSLALAGLRPVQERAPGMAGMVEGHASGEVQIAPGANGQAPFRIAALNGSLAMRRLAVDQQALGDLTLQAGTQGLALTASLNGELVGAGVSGNVDVHLDGDYPVRGQLRAQRLALSTLLARFSRQNQEHPNVEAFAEGGLNFSGSALRPESIRGVLEIPVLEIRPTAELANVARPGDLVLRNNGPILVDVDSKLAHIRQARVSGKNTSLSAGGTLAFTSRNPWNVRIQGQVNLALLRDLDPDMYSSGDVALDATLRGPLARPEIYGRVDLRNASLNYGDLPNGVSNANGVIFLYRDRASIDRLTAESGGGRISTSGFVTFGPVSYHLQVKAEQVRVRYPEGVSSTMNAGLTLTGTIDRSVLAGDISLTRMSFNPRTDLGSVLASAAAPVQTPGRPGPFLRGLHFDVHIQTAPQVRLETKLTRGLQAEADLRLRGDPTRPVLLGRALVNQGEIIFFGNQYTIDSGEIIFVNPARIQPVLNLDLETKARGVEVTLNVSGPIDRLNLTYRSDPPLPFSEIIALLATGRTPTNTPMPVTSAPETAQTFQQTGASALLSQAIASPIAGRLQRFFGVSRLKIDPQLTGLTGTNAAARVTLEQQVSSDITFTYVTNLARAQAQTIQIEWDLSKNWSAVAVREENGLFGIDFLYRKQFK